MENPRTDGVRKFRDRESLEENASYSRNTTQFGALDAASVQPLYVSSRSSRVDDAAAPRRAISRRFSRVFSGSLTCLRDRTLTCFAKTRSGEISKFLVFPTLSHHFNAPACRLGKSADS